MAMSGGNDDGQPMMEMNTTPLIDVMLVLLIMFIITIPIQTHAVKVDLPINSKNQPQPPIDPQKNKNVMTTDNKILWNGNAISNGQLVSLLQEGLRMPIEPELQFEPDANASYDLSSRVLNIIKGSGITKFGFVGNERYASFTKEEGA